MKSNLIDITSRHHTHEGLLLILTKLKFILKPIRAQKQKKCAHCGQNDSIKRFISIENLPNRRRYWRFQLIGLMNRIEESESESADF